MADEYRSHSTLINEARLLASAPETAAAWLAKPGRDLRWGGDADDMLELKLLIRNESLIDLALAEHGLSNEVLRQLFDRGNEVLRAAVLSNQRFLKSSFGVRYWTFAAEEDDFSWMAELSDVEAEALFANPSLPDHFVAEFFEQKGVWEKLNDDQRLRAASYIIQTLSKRPTRDDFQDGWADYSYSEVFDKAWTFSRLAPVSLKWAYQLGELYSHLAPSAFSKFDALQTADRWQAPEGEQKELDRELKDNKMGYLGSFQRVRCGLARLAAERSYEKIDQRAAILKNDDVAIRCGGYLVFRFSADEIKAFCKMDGKLACLHLVGNDNVWKKQESRSALQEACRVASKGDDSVMSASLDFRNREKKLRELHPEWFKDEDRLDDGIDDKPLTESSIGEMTDRIAGSHAFTSLKTFIEAQAKAEAVRFWIIVIILAIIAIRL